LRVGSQMIDSPTVLNRSPNCRAVPNVRLNELDVRSATLMKRNIAAIEHANPLASID
jgi:hypothetical protein